MTVKKQSILFIGECGSGKSSLLRLVTEVRDEGLFKVGDGSRACTKEIQWSEYTNIFFYDTPGVGGGKEGDVTDIRAERRIRQQILVLDEMQGLGLIALVHRRGASFQHSEKVYNTFVRGIFNRNLPVLLVITHMDPSMESREREGEFRSIKNEFDCKSIFFQAYIPACSMSCPTGGGVAPDVAEAIQSAREDTRKRLLDTIHGHILVAGVKCPETTPPPQPSKRAASCNCTIL